VSVGDTSVLIQSARAHRTVFPPAVFVVAINGGLAGVRFPAKADHQPPHVHGG
jgi:hypothetical protein